MKSIAPLFQSKAERFLGKIKTKAVNYAKGIPKSKLGHYTESFIVKGTEIVSPSRRAIYKIGKR